MSPSRSYRLDESRGIVDATWRTTEPPEWIVHEALRTSCTACHVDVLISEDDQTDGLFNMVVIHDDGCPEAKDVGS